MNIDNEHIDQTLLDEDSRIDAYIKGLMTVDEEQRFMQELESKPEMKAKAIAMARLAKGLKEVGKEQDQVIKDAFMASNEDDVEQAVQSAFGQRQAKVVSFRKVATWLSVAASLIIVVWGSVSYIDYRRTTALADEYMDSFSTSLIARGPESSKETEQKLESLFDNIRMKKDIDYTLHELSICWELSMMETYNDYTDYSAEIGWHLAIGYLKDNDKEGARNVLKVIVSKSENGSAINRRAKELLEML